MVKQHTGLQLEDDPEFERRSAKLETLAWVGMVLFVLIGFSGLLGKGGLSWQTRQSRYGTFSLEYERSLRFGSSSDWTVYLNHTGKRPAHFWMSNSLLAKMDLKHIQPMPVLSIAEKEGILFNFNSGSLPAVIHLSFCPDANWRLDGKFVLNGQDTLEVNCFIFP